MQVDQDTEQSLARRIDRLERQNLKLRLAGAIVVLLGSGGALDRNERSEKDAGNGSDHHQGCERNLPDDPRDGRRWARDHDAR